MDNCYFCHTPVFTEEVQIRLEVQRVQFKPAEIVTEAAHQERFWRVREFRIKQSKRERLERVAAEMREKNKRVIRIRETLRARSK